MLSSATQVDGAPERGRAKEAILSVPEVESDDGQAAPADGPAGPPPIEPPRKRGGWGPIGTYWRGEYSLGVSFWVVSLIVDILVYGVVFAVALGIGAIGFYNPYSLFGIVVFTWTALLLLTLWDNVGLWRAARRHKSEQRARGRTRFWAILVQFLIVLGVLSTVKDVVLVAIPQLRGSYALAFQGDPQIDDFAIRVMRDGTELEIAGGFKYGLDAALRETLQTSPNVKVVHLASIGGRVGEAMKVHKTIADHKLDTYVVDGCYSACTLAFAAGRKRWLGEGGVLGFHSASFPGWAMSDAAVANQQQESILVGDGFDADFVRKALATPASSMFIPTSKELVAAWAITGVAPNDMFAASGLGIGLTQESFTQWIREVSPVFAAIERGEPQMAAKMYAGYFDSYVEGATLAAILTAISDDISAQLAKKNPLMDDETALAMGRLLIDRYSGLRLFDPKGCYEFSNGMNGIVPNGKLSDELIERDQAMKMQILASTMPPPAMPKEELDQGWEAVIQALRTGPHARHLNVLERRPTPDEYANYCTISIAFYEAILDQPAPLAAALMRDTVTR